MAKGWRLWESIPTTIASKVEDIPWTFRENLSRLGERVFHQLGVQKWCPAFQHQGCSNGDQQESLKKCGWTQIKGCSRIQQDAILWPMLEESCCWNQAFLCWWSQGGSKVAWYDCHKNPCSMWQQPFNIEWGRFDTHVLHSKQHPSGLDLCVSW